MYQIGEKVVYVSSGICRITDIKKLDDYGTGDELFYVLTPEEGPKATLFVSTEDPGNALRLVMTRDEAEDLIRDIPEIDHLQIENEKLREKCYQRAVFSSDCRELVKLLKMLYLRRRTRISAGKKVTSTDEKYFKIAEKNLFSEVACALEKSPSEIREMIVEMIKETENK